MVLVNFISEYILIFFRIKLAEKQYMDAFNDELEAFKERVRSRAKVRIEEAIKKIEEVINY